MRLLYAREPSASTSTRGGKMQTKTITGATTIKSDDLGEVSAVFATFDVIDKDGDVTFPGAFEDGAEVDVSSFGHQVWMGGVPVGEGTIRTTRKEAIVDAQFYMETEAGRETFALIKARGVKQEWSYGFDTLNAPETVTVNGRKANALRRLKVHEVSPVWRGAGIRTRTLAAKAARDAAEEGTSPMTDYLAAIRPHETALTRKAWNFADTGVYIPDDVTIDDLRAIHAYVNPAGDPADVKSYDFAHHHGPDEEANLRACFAGVGRLLKSDHGLTEAEAEAVHAHLAGHLDDGDIEAPGMRSESGILKLNAELAVVLADWSTARARVWDTKRTRAGKGKSLGATTVMVLEWIADDQRETKSLLDSPQEEADREFARFVRSQLPGV
jgi:hypothetical protein